MKNLRSFSLSSTSIFCCDSSIVAINEFVRFSCSSCAFIWFFVNLEALPQNWYCQFFLFSYQLLPSSNVGVSALYDLHYQQEFDLKNKFFLKESCRTQHIHTCSKCTVKILEQDVEYVSKSTETLEQSLKYVQN